MVVTIMFIIGVTALFVWCVADTNGPRPGAA